jgi:DNA-binding beta-propeller fold protein YncE
MPHTQAAFIPVPPGPKPGFDHADVYRSKGGTRLYVAHTGADRVDVIDCGRNAYLGAIPDLPGVAGVLIDGDHDRLFTSDRAAARVSLFRCSDEALLGRVAVGAHPNGLAYDPGRRRLFVFNLGDPPGTGCTASVVDVAAMAVRATVALPGRPRWAVYDEAADRIFVNIREPAQIAVLDAAAPGIERAQAVPASGPHGLGLLGDRLFCAADGGALIALHRDTGAILGSVPLPGEPDVVMVDADRQRLYVAVGRPGVVCVVDAARLTLVETIATEVGAHTIGWSPEPRALYAFLPARPGVAVFVES